MFFDRRWVAVVTEQRFELAMAGLEAVLVVPQRVVGIEPDDHDRERTGERCGAFDGGYPQIWSGSPRGQRASVRSDPWRRVSVLGAVKRRSARCCSNAASVGPSCFLSAIRSGIGTATRSVRPISAGRGAAGWEMVDRRPSVSLAAGAVDESFDEPARSPSGA